MVHITSSYAPLQDKDPILAMDPCSLMNSIEIKSHQVEDVYVLACSDPAGVDAKCGNLIIFSQAPDDKVAKGDWYGGVTLKDVKVLLKQHIGEGGRMESATQVAIESRYICFAGCLALEFDLETATAVSADYGHCIYSETLVAAVSRCV
ncbi:hypothetical protein RIF29_00285 [Crotalaria pallida]|uniref:Uncharacterized protein n=1 Tax=Crotalaria pallida TaxID=3830 RepID=A0AAN9IVM5_CROPI